jgi:purine-binding chemotaxis protein CheW
VKKLDILNDQIETLTAEDTQKDMFLTFLIGEVTYGIDISLVTEIVGLQPITELPDLPGYLKGIINLRGRIIPVLDVRLRFKQAARDYNERTCIIIVTSGGLNLGLIVDTVAEVVNIPETDIEAPPAMQGVTANPFIKAIAKVEDQVKLLLNCDRLLTGEIAEQLSEAI